MSKYFDGCYHCRNCDFKEPVGQLSTGWNIKAMLCPKCSKGKMIPENPYLLDIAKIRLGECNTASHDGIKHCAYEQCRKDMLDAGYVRLKSLQQLSKEIREINQANGWNVTQERDWKDTAYKIPAILALEHSEVSESLEAFRHDDLDNFLEEQADVLIRVLDCVGAFTEDFDAVVNAKLDKNRSRGYRHGGKRV